MTSWQILEGDCRDLLATLPERSVQTVVTSPPYFGLRDYGHDGQIGLEPSPDEFVAALVGVFREVRRVLRDDGTVWLNLGDSFCSTDKWGGGKSGNTGKHTTNGQDVPSWAVRARKAPMEGVKPKDLLGIPWMVAFALRADGWYLRSDIIWAKPNPMPESVTDRPTKAHEYLFLLSKGPRYFYDADAIREGTTVEADGRLERPGRESTARAARTDGAGRRENGRGGFTVAGYLPPEGGRNKRSVWTVATQPYPGAHFATFPPKLIEPCILAGSSPRACGVCGAPWRRVVERTLENTEGRAPATKDHHAGIAAPDAIARNGQGRAGDAVVRTVGWEPTCEHTDDTGHSVVLDPFAGAGTTGVVARLLGRDFIGCELNPTYAQMARDRIESEGRPGNRRHEPAKVDAGQLDMFAALDAG